MRASVSTLPENAGRRRAVVGVPFAIAGVWLAAHLPFLPVSLGDIDSINFALGLREFNVALHQPHPPGYPVYMVLGHMSLAAVSSLTSLAPMEAEALALALWSALAGALAILAAARLFRAVELLSQPPSTSHPPPTTQYSASSLWATALLAVTPLFWMCGLRPMSDMPGLAAALAAQMLLLEGMRNPRRLAQGALVAGLAAGVRIQTLSLTVPLLALALVMAARTGLRGGHWAGFIGTIARPVGALVAGVLLWGIPLVMVGGGVNEFMRALSSQADEDFAWVDMLWSNPTLHRLAFAVFDTFVPPWASMPLFVAVAAAAILGGIVAFVRARAALGLMLVAFVPYVVYHLLLQETITVRYSLPALPLVAWLAVQGFQLASQWTPMVAVPMVGAALVVGVSGGIAYGSNPHPGFRAIADAARRAELQPPAATYAHYAIRRPLQVANVASLHFVEPRRQYEWLGLMDYWKGGGTAPVWFFADPLRSDLESIDPRSRRDVVRYRWAAASRPELRGTRPLGVDWYRLQPPGWIAGEGWSLTPETGGLTRATGAGPTDRPIEALVRRRPGPMHLVVGGRHLGSPGDPDGELELTVDGVVLDRWRLTVAERNFLRFIDVPGLAAGPGQYARLQIASRTASDDARSAEVAIRQFDIQPATELILGFGEGWHEAEAVPAIGLQWRWTSARSILRLKGPPVAVRVMLRGESPLKYIAAPPTVTIVAGGRTLATFHPSADFEWSVDVPADAWVASGGAIAIETSPVYLPGPAEGTDDNRHLGLRLYDTRVTTVGPAIDSR